MSDQTQQDGAEPSFDGELAACYAATEQNHPDIAVSYSEMIDRLEKAEAGMSAPRPGDAMPSFMLPDMQGRLVRLCDLHASGPLVISFNRGHWCPFCKVELQALQDISSDIASLDGSIVSITPDTSKFTRQRRDELDLTFPILSDIDNAYALETGLLVTLGERLNSQYLDIGIDLEKYQGARSWFVPIPATFILDRDGIVRSAFVDPNFSKRMSPEDVLSAVRKISTG